MPANPAKSNDYIYGEMFKVAESFEYFLDEYVWIEDKLDKMAIKLDMWPSQRMLVPIIRDERLLIIIKAHQLGYTWLWVAAHALWRAITKQLEHIIVNSFNENVGIEIINRIEFIRQRLPPEIFNIPISKKTTQEIVFGHTDAEGNLVPSIIQVIPATEKGAQSKTPTLLIIDESAQNRYVQQTYVASKPGIDSAQGQIIIISNAIKNAPGWPFTRQIYTNSIKGLNTFKRVFLPWQAHPHRPPNFREIQLAEGMDEDDFSQRYPETEAEAISTQYGSYFGKVLARHDESIMDGVTGTLKKNQFKESEFVEEKRGVLEVWRFPYMLADGWDGLMWEQRYCIGSDVSEGIGESYSVAYVMDRLLDEIVARMRSRRIDAHVWGTMLHQLSLYYDNALIVPERTGAGITTVKRLQELNANLYVKMIAGKAGSPVTKEIGWSETHNSKHELCGDLKTWMRDVSTPAVYCNLLLDECSTYILDEIGRLNPESGKYGDCVIGAGCTIQGDLFIGRKPEAVIPPPTGWQKRHREGRL